MGWLGLVGDIISVIDVVDATTGQPGVSGTMTPDAFNQLITDASSFSVTLNSGQRNAIQWIATKDRILIGTSGGEWRMEGHTSKPLTPANFDLKPQSVWGSKDMQPLVLHEAVLFVDFVGKKLREMIYDGNQERYTSPDILKLAEHLTRSGGITTMAYQKNPNSIIWATLANGDLISCTYVREQDVIAWARHPLGTSTAIEADNEVEEITYNDYTQFIVGINSAAATYKYIANGTTENTLDTEWGEDGYWKGPTAGGVCYDVLQLSDGRILVAHTHYTVTMIGTDGVTDTTWSTNGSFRWPKIGGVENIQPRKILQDNDGNFHLLGGINASGYTYIKLDSDGTFITGIYQKRLNLFRDAFWSDSTKTRIIGVGGTTVISGESPNMMAINATEGVLDTSWPGNVGNAGYAELGSTIYEAKVLSDGGFVVRQNDAGNTFTKFLANGTGVDVTWGAIGIVPLGTTVINADSRRMAEKDDELYVLVDANIGGDNHASMSHIDTDGSIILTNNYEVAQGVYHALELIDDKIFMGTTSADNSRFNIEQWTTSFVYESGFDIDDATNISFILPDEETREFTIDKVRVEGIGYANSVCVIPGTTEDEVWITVERVINDSIVQYIERMAPRNFGTEQADAFFVDSGLTYDGEPTTTLTGLDHLEGETVAILGDGAVFPTQTVSGGSITLPEEVSVAQVGLPFTYKLKPMRMDQAEAENTKGSVKQITEVVVSFFKTLNAKYSDGTRTREFKWRTTEPYTTPPDLYTGDKKVPSISGFSVEDPIEITGNDPLPCTVRAMILRIEKTGR